MKNLKNTNKRNIKNWSIKSKSGEVITGRDKAILRWHEFYSTLYHSNRQVFTSQSSPIPPTTPCEIENALKKVNKGKSPGPYNITSGLLIACRLYFKHDTAQKVNFPLRILSVNVTKSTVSCRFGHIY